MSTLTPDLKAGVAPLPPGSEACGCCDSIDPVTPQAHANRHGLSAIGYRIGGYRHFQESLLAGLSDSQFQPLERLLTRDPDDFTLGLIDAFACTADVLGFYQERIANESWLRTATERTSLQEMAQLIGYRLRPGVAAETWLAFALEPPREPPANAPKEPGAFVTGIPAQVTLAAGLKVQSVPGPDEKPQTFETVEAIDARPEWSAMRPWLTQARLPAQGDRHTWLQGVRTALKPGDALLLVGAGFASNAADNLWDFRVLSKVIADPDHGRTCVAWERGLDSPYPATGTRVFALRQRASVFGHNAPMWRTMPTDFQTAYNHSGLSIDDTWIGVGTWHMLATAIHLDNDWPEFVISRAGATATGGHVDLDAAYPAIASGSFAVLAHGQYDYPDGAAPSGSDVELYQVTSVTDVSRDEFALSGKSTRLRLDGGRYEVFRGDVRGTRVFAQSEELQFAAYPVETPVSGDAIPVAVAPAGLESGRRLIIQGRTAAGAAVVHQATLAGARAASAHAWLDIAPPLPVALQRDSVYVAGNVALARHGETVTQILGSGDASQPHPRFELKQLPLTYRAAPTELGAASELTVRVGGIEWKERSTLYGAGSNDRAFTLQTDEAGRDWVRFGDGHSGARLPSGVNNLRATYRKGIGRDGNVRAETLTQLMTRPLGLKGTANPGAAQGGTDPEPAEHARESIPLTTRTLGRAVSLLDYEDFARAYTGIAKAQAAVLRLRHGTVIGITVAGQDGAAVSETNPVRINLLGALHDNGDPQVGVRLLGYQASTFRLGLKVKCHPDHDAPTVLAAVEAALRLAFSFARRSLGQPVQQSEVIAVAHTVPGVVAVDLDLLYGGTAPYAQTLPSAQTRLLASRMRVVDGVPLPAELLSLHPGPLDRLEVMP